MRAALAALVDALSSSSPVAFAFALALVVVDAAPPELSSPPPNDDDDDDDAFDVMFDVAALSAERCLRARC